MKISLEPGAEEPVVLTPHAPPTQDTDLQKIQRLLGSLHRSDTEQQPPPTSRGDTLAQLVTVFADKIDPFLKMASTFAEHSHTARKAEAEFRSKMATVAAWIVVVIVGMASLLTYVGRLDGSTYGFLLGLIVGYVLTFVRDAIRPAKEP